MNMILISTGLGVTLFLIAFLGFREGLRLGMKTSKGEAPQPINPIKAVIDIKEQHEAKKESEKADQELEDIFSYSKESAMEALKNEALKKGLG